MNKTARRITHVAEVGLRVADLQLMIDFYRDVLGFEVEIAHPTHAFLKAGELESPLGEIGHALILGLFDRRAEVDARASSLDHLAFEVPPEHYDEELDRFRSMGMVIKERSWPDTLDWRARSFFFRDPEENVIEIIAAGAA